MREDLKHCKYTMFHPLNGFEEVKWNGKGSYRISAFSFSSSSMFFPRR